MILATDSNGDGTATVHRGAYQPKWLRPEAWAGAMMARARL
jgi:hypothetical protein